MHTWPWLFPHDASLGMHVPFNPGLPNNGSNKYELLADRDGTGWTIQLNRALGEGAPWLCFCHFHLPRLQQALGCKRTFPPRPASHRLRNKGQLIQTCRRLLILHARLPRHPDEWTSAISHKNAHAQSVPRQKRPGRRRRRVLGLT